MKKIICLLAMACVTSCVSAPKENTFMEGEGRNPNQVTTNFGKALKGDAHPCTDFSGVYKGKRMIENPSFPLAKEPVSMKLKVIQTKCNKVFLETAYDPEPFYGKGDTYTHELEKEINPDNFHLKFANFDENQLILSHTFIHDDGKSGSAWLSILGKNSKGKLVYDSEVHHVKGGGGKVRHRFVED